ncbi:hypothetical protein P8935_21315 [Telmatobacter sp. DSM 110680]|uniref:Uncharacterized protein n=1 Tax=Telmatobacter sp. DSM 110680 TaxID=3036704 RepID=A0AAU7DHH9_9BACT
MREEPGAEVNAGSEREGLKGSDQDLARKYTTALVLYAILAALSWFTLDGKIQVGGKLVELRLIPLLIIGGLALRTVVAMKAEKIRREGEQGR